MLKILLLSAMFGIGLETDQIGTTSSATVRAWMKNSTGISLSYGETVIDRSKISQSTLCVRKKIYKGLYAGGKLTEIKTEKIKVKGNGIFLGEELSFGFYWRIGYTWMNDDQIDIHGTDGIVGFVWYWK